MRRTRVRPMFDRDWHYFKWGVIAGCLFAGVWEHFGILWGLALEVVVLVALHYFASPHRTPRRWR